MNVIVDIGNTRGKYAIFDGDTLLERGEEPFGWHARAIACRARGEAVNLLLASTGPVPAGLRERSREVATRFIEASPAMPLPARVEYDTPETLGIDRVAGCVAGAALYPGRALLVVDAGTALTFNFADAAGTFLGGNISPGVQARYRALHEFTERLPLVAGDAPGEGIGRNTRDAILYGVTRGVLAEIRDYAAAFRREHPAGALLLTGGDCRWLAGHLPGEFRVEEHLVMIGLNKILAYQQTTER
jgi:type III pantothenate kinase